MPKRRNSIAEQWAPRRRSMLESPAYRVMSLSAHRVLSRIALEHCRHGGQENGKLPVTYNDFIEYGVHHASVAPAIRELEALGIAEVTEHGCGGNREYRRPNLFRLTSVQNVRGPAPTDEWKRIETVKEAEQIARRARNAKDRRSVDFGHRSWRVRKSKSKTEKCNVSTRFSGIEKEEVPVPDSSPTARPLKPVPPSISRVGEQSEPSVSYNGKGR